MLKALSFALAMSVAAAHAEEAASPAQSFASHPDFVRALDEAARNNPEMARPEVRAAVSEALDRQLQEAVRPPAASQGEGGGARPAKDAAEGPAGAGRRRSVIQDVPQLGGSDRSADARPLRGFAEMRPSGGSFTVLRRP